jgi:hypothetical protein
MSCPQFGKYHKLIAILTVFLLVLLLASPGLPQDNNIGLSPEENDRQQMLKREAANALRRLKRSMEKDGFYSGRVALNVWQSTALDAGTFDQEQYDKFKTQLYEKSVSDSLRCVEEALEEEDIYNANFCLQTWRMHSKELGTYDQDDYEVYLKKMADAKAANAARRAKEK